MKSLYKLSILFFSGHFSMIASLASIIGVILIFINDKVNSIIALCAFILFLIIILFRFFNILNRFMIQKTENGYYKFATYLNYSTKDGQHIVYELQKYLQCKTFMMDDHIHDFYWTGTNPPIVSSTLQEFKRVIKGANKGDYDKVLLKFKTPLLYNDFSIVHIKMDLDDSDNSSKPFCSQKIIEKVQLISFRIELKHLENNQEARLERKKINTQLDQEYELVEYISFDQNSRSYSYNLFDPEVGYSYRIKWG